LVFFNNKGYGEIIPISLNEKIYGLFLIIISCCVFGYVLNKIGNFVSALDDLV